MKIIGIIPVRYNSTRFPGKPLIDLSGKSMIQRVYEQAKKSKSLSEVFVATDDDRIISHVREFTEEVIKTDVQHMSGTDRCREAVQKINCSFDYVINVQGDEPLIDPHQIDELASILDGNVELATQVSSVNDQTLLFSESSVKVVLNQSMEAMYFSRSVIPHYRNLPHEEWRSKHHYYRHTGLYAYRVDILEKICQLPVSSLEKAESLEQLRWLEHGFKIKCIITAHETLPVDTPDDVKAVLKRLKETEHDQG